MPLSHVTRGSIGLVVVLLVAAGLRLWHLDFDLPEVRYVDAPKFTVPAVHMVEHGSPRPIHFQHPGLYSGLLALLYGGLGIGSDYGRELAATAVAAAAGIAVVVATAAAASACGGPLASVAAAALVAVSPAMVTQSRTPAPDTLCLLFATLAVALAARRPLGAARWAVIGSAAGLAVGAKWTGLFVAPALAVAAIAAAYRQRRLAALATALAGCAVGGLVAFFTTTPFFLAYHDQYAAEAARILAIERAGQIGRVQLGALDYLLSDTPTWEMPWLGTSLHSAIGWPAVALAAGGVALAAAGRLGFAGALYAATAVLYVASISGAGWIKAVRFLLPSLPFLAALAGACAERLVPPAWRSRPSAWMLVALVVTAPLLPPSARYVAALREPSTNARARDWLRTHVPPGTRVFVGPFFTEDLHALPYQTRWLPDVGERLYGLPAERGTSTERDPIYAPHLVDALAAERVAYAVLNSYFDDAFLPVPENRRFFPRSVENHAAFMARLEERADLVHEEVGWRAGRIGPDVRIWRLRAEGSAPGR